MADDKIRSGVLTTIQCAAVSSSHIGFSTTLTAHDRADFTPALSDKQWSMVLNIFNTINFQSSSNDKFFCKSSSQWILDTGASMHMTGNRQLLVDLCDTLPSPIMLPDGTQTNAVQEGTVKIDEKVKISHVLYVPQLTCNLLSFSQLLTELTCIVTLSNKLCVLQERTSRMVIGVGQERNGVYWLRFFIPTNKVFHATTSDSYTLWHQRLGHPSSQIVSLLPIVGSAASRSNLHTPCDICFQAKQTRASFPISSSKATELFELVHCDVWGPYSTVSSCGASYFLTIVDDFSRGLWVYLMATKAEVGQIFRNFCAMVRTQFNKPVRRVRSDNGTEFIALKTYFSEQGILFETSCVGTPQQNGRVERKHRHILNVARALRFQGNLPLDFWGECILTAGYLINRTPSVINCGKTPYELIFGRTPSYTHLRNFGCLCFASTIPRDRNKFHSRSRKCIFVGYPHGQKGWRLFDLEKKEFFNSRDVVFCEEKFPFRDVTPQLETQPACESHPAAYETFPPTGTLDDLNTTSLTSMDLGGNSGPDIVSNAPSSSVVADTISISSPAQTDSATPPEPRHSTRARVPSTRLRDYVCHTACAKDPISLQPASSPSSGTPYPIANYVNCNNLSAPYVRLLAAITAGLEPSHFSQAVRHSCWREAMKLEIDALERNGTWEITNLPPGKKAIGCKWVYRIKYHSNGTIERYKARLVVLGNKQVAGVDYYETFAPVAKMTSVRVFLAVAAIRDWELHQMDVHNAFLHGDLDEEVYMSLPPGFSNATPNKVCRLRKSLYGLRQAPRNWFAKLSSALKNFGFVQSYADYSLFSLTRNDTTIHVLVYVDDLIIGGNNSIAISAFKQYLSKCFHMKDLGPLKYFLGIEIARGPSGLILSQRKYALDIISEAGLLGSKPYEFPMEQNHNLSRATGSDFSNPEQYRRLVGRLIYLTITRPELCFAVHTLAQFMQHPKEAHWHAALRVVRYLKGHPGQGLFLRRDSDIHINAYCDSDWATCPLTRRSLTGYFVMLGCSPISWKTKKQHTVSRSSAEAEYRAMADTCCELTWLKALLKSLGIIHNKPMRLFSDSQSAIHIAANPVFHERTKHIEIDCHYVRDQIQMGHVSTSYIRTTAQLADIFTKALGKHQFQTLLSKLGTRDLHAPT